MSDFFDALVRQPMIDAIEGGQTASGYLVLPNGDTYGWGFLSGEARSTNRVPSKASGRRGTRRNWKRKHPPGWFERLLGFEGATVRR